MFGRLHISCLLLTSLPQVRDNIKRRMGNLDFDYEAPTATFDRSKVKGLVATLVRLQQGDYNKATALEITAGGRLYNVVVDSDEVGKQILQHGKLKKRVTLIPLNRIQPYKISDNVSVINCSTLCVANTSAFHRKSRRWKPRRMAGPVWPSTSLSTQMK